MQWVVLQTDALFFALIAIATLYALAAMRHEPMRAPWREVAANPFAASSAVVLAVFVGVALLDSVHFHPRIERAEASAVGAEAVAGSAGESAESSESGQSGEPGEAGQSGQSGDNPQVGEPQYSTEILSLLDVVLRPLREHTERSYSAPFATHAFSKELIELPDGGTRRDYPRLEHGGAHLFATETNASEVPQMVRSKAADIAMRAGFGGLRGLVIIGLLALLASAIAGHPGQLRRTLTGEGRSTRRTVWTTLTMVVVLISVLAALGTHWHILGTDKVGNDVLYQAIKSIRTGILIGTLTTLVMLPLALLLGVAAGYFRGWVDDVIQYLYTTLSSIPGVLLIAAMALLLEAYMARNAELFTSLTARADLKLLALCAILGVTSWTGLCRLLRGEVLKVREIEFVQAARSLGVGHARILSRHLLPNVMHIVMISIVLDFSNLVLAEAVLSYINIGVDPTMESWGNMINSARLELARDPVVWWSLVAAFLFMFTLVLAANLFADAVRDAFDPRLRMRGGE